MGYTPRDTGEFVRSGGKGSSERNYGARKKYDDIDWGKTNVLEEGNGFVKVGDKKIRKKYKLI